jgi:hypothetical protein
MKNLISRNNKTTKKYFLKSNIPVPLDNNIIFYDQSATEFFDNFHHNFEILN